MDAERMVKVYHRIKTAVELEEETGWDQDAWSWQGRVSRGCGTTHCVAGWTCAEAGDRMIYNPTLGIAGTCRTRDGEVLRIAQRAQELLELDDDQARELFYQLNTDLEQLRAWIVRQDPSLDALL